MNPDLASQLRRLGLGKGIDGLKPSEQRRAARTVEQLLPGRFQPAGEATCFVAEERYDLASFHGRLAVGDLLGVSPAVAAQVAQEPGLDQLSWRDLLFIDTETTGLSGGAGTIAFLVGIGFFEETHFTVLQYFLRSPADEPAMLEALSEQFSKRPGIVSFNGRSFDLPLLESRYILNRRHPPFLAAPHLDLLHPSRRLWRDSLEACRLLTLEAEVLDVQRDQADIPSGIIPLIYRDYLLTGNGVEMPRIFYHNQVDVLSMVVLTARICRLFEYPAENVQGGLEWFALARWYETLNLAGRAEKAYQQAIGADLPSRVYEVALWRLGWLLKRADRPDEAAGIWRQLAAVELDDVQGHVELAKFHEWQRGDLGKAADWTRKALALVERWPKGVQKLVWPELAHRLARLERKLARSDE